MKKVLIIFICLIMLVLQRAYAIDETVNKLSLSYGTALSLAVSNQENRFNQSIQKSLENIRNLSIHPVRPYFNLRYETPFKQIDNNLTLNLSYALFNGSEWMYKNEDKLRARVEEWKLTDLQKDLMYEVFNLYMLVYTYQDNQAKLTNAKSQLMQMFLDV